MAIVMAAAADLGYTVMSSFLINIIDEYCTFGFPYLVTLPSAQTVVNLANMLNLGILTLFIARNPLSLVLYPILGPISPTVIPGNGL